MKKLITLTAIVVTAFLFACNDAKDPKDKEIPASTETPPPAPADTVAVKPVN